MPELLEIVAHGVTAILATWLGLLVFTRALSAPGRGAFSLLCLLLVTWSVAIIVQRIGSGSLGMALNFAEDLAAFLLPAATLHIALAIGIEGRWPRSAKGGVASAYAVCGLAVLQSAMDPAHPIVVDGPGFEPFGLPGAVTGWAFIVVRAIIFAAGVAVLVVALRESGPDRARRRQLQYALATVGFGVIGGMLRILPDNVGGPAWIGVSIIAAAIVMAAYTVLSQGIFLAADVAARAFRWSVAMGLGVVAYVGLLVLLDRWAADALGIDIPLVTALAVVVTIAVFDPVADGVRAFIARRSGQGVGNARLLRALGNDIVTAQHPARSIEPALARLVRTFGLIGASVVDGGGRAVAFAGRLDAADGQLLRLPLRSGSADHGVATFGRKRSGLPFDDREAAALALAVSYLAASLELAGRHHEQASALEQLSAERARVESQGAALTEALGAVAASRPGLSVYALGPLRAERNGERIRRWGGQKAGSRQAEAVFAFLFDRGERGASKDEILELIWPDVDLDRADVAFHRTLLGLRLTLDPGRRRRSADGVISYHNDRYRLSPTAVAWSDVTQFETLLAEAARADGAGSVGLLEQARGLYRGDYLDDCPYYGDSAQVEERREQLRGRYVDLLNDLGDVYRARGDRAGAADSRRRASAIAGREAEGSLAS